MIERAMSPDPGDLARFQACFERNGSLRTADALEWQYVRNPPGRLFADVALDADRFAAIYATLPVFVRINGRRQLALQSLDTLTDVDFRGRGLFTRLASRTFARAQSEQVAFIYGFPNGSSAHGFFGKLGWTTLDPVPFLIRPLRTRYAAARLPYVGRFAAAFPDVPLRLPTLRAVRTHSIVRFDSQVDALWGAFARDVGVAVERDAGYLNWRLVDKPGGAYTILGVEEDGRLAAFVAFVVHGKHGGRVGYVMDLLTLPQRKWMGRRLLSVALERMSHDGADVALAWCLAHSPNYATHLAAGFLPFPERLRPIELHVGARAFDPGVGHLIQDRRKWYLSYLDSDTV